MPGNARMRDKLPNMLHTRDLSMRGRQEPPRRLLSSGPPRAPDATRAHEFRFSMTSSLPPSPSLRSRMLGATRWVVPVSYTHLRAHETVLDLVCRLLLEKKKKK